MKIIDQSYQILSSRPTIESIPTMIEIAGRTCYKSEDKISVDSADKFCRMLIKRGHEAMIEHGSISVRFITDRGVSHELVRHRIASFAQESTRYVSYKDSNMEFIRPVFDWAAVDIEHELQEGGDTLSLNNFCNLSNWYTALCTSEGCYKTMIKGGCSPQEARSVLPNSLKTEVVVTANIREWRKIFELRCAIGAHPQIRALMLPLLQELYSIVPCLFEDLYLKYNKEN